MYRCFFIGALVNAAEIHNGKRRLSPSYRDVLRSAIESPLSLARFRLPPTYEARGEQLRAQRGRHICPKQWGLLLPFPYPLYQTLSGEPN